MTATLTLPDLLAEHGEAITRATLQAYPPVYTAHNRDDWGYDLRTLKRRPLGAQGDAIRAAAVSLQRHRGTNLVGEMGVGKTFLGAAAAHVAGFRRVLVLCPPHLVRKWKREVEDTVPNANAVIVGRISDLGRLPLRSRRPLYVIVSREKAKLSYRWKPAVVRRPGSSAGHIEYDGLGQLVRRNCCPGCWQTVVDDEGIPISLVELQHRKHKCGNCNTLLWQADRSGPARVPLADYINRRMPGVFQILVTDEAHEYKARGSAQGIAAATLAEACGKTLTLTGTLMGGYASTLFHLLWRFNPEVRADFAYGEESRWISRYGVQEKVTRESDDEVLEDGRSSRRRAYRTTTREKPGASPAMLFHLFGNTVFLRLADVAKDLPPYREEVRTVLMDRRDDAGPSQASAYRRLSEDLHTAVMAALAGGSRRLLGSYLQALLAYPDACTQGETVVDPASGAVIGSAPALDDGRIYPKERALLDLCVEEKQLGRRVIVYVTHTETRDITPRLVRLLTDAGLQVANLKATTVSPDRREEWMERRVTDGVDVLLVHPRLVQTGLDLVDFPTLVWFETEYSVYTMRQASRRSWRIGQKLPVRVVYLAYRATLQAQALELVARKLQTSLMVEGEIGDSGLAAHAADGDDLTLELARALTEGKEVSESSLEALFAQAEQVAADAAAALDAGQMESEADPEPEPLTGEAAERDRESRLLADLLGPDIGDQLSLL